MTIVHRLVSILRWVFQRHRVESELHRDIESFIELSAADKVRDGMVPEEARRLARLELGGMDQVKERVRTERRGALLDELSQDVHYALRMFAKSPALTIIVVVTLAVGIGANLTAFGLARTIFWQPVPVPEPHRLIALYNRAERGAGAYSGLSYPEYEYFRDHSDVLSGFATYVRIHFLVNVGNEVEKIPGEIVSSNYFSVLGTPLVLGRPFSAGNDRSLGTTPEVVLSHGLWQRRFGGDRNVLGQSIRIEKQSFTVVGVAAPVFQGVLMDWLELPQLWIPLNMYPESLFTFKILERWDWHAMMVVGRLNAGVGLDRAAAALKPLDARMSTDHPERVQAFRGKYESTIDVLPLQRARFFPAYRETILSTVQVVAVVMAILLGVACLSLVNLMIAKSTTRQRELAVRVALGASRGRLLRQLIVENILLSIMGGVAAIIVASLAWKSIALFGRPFRVWLPAEFTLDFQSGAFMVGLALLLGIMFAIWPIRNAAKVDVHSLLKGDTRGGRSIGLRFRSALVTAQIAASVALLTCASLFVQTLQNTAGEDRYVDRDRITVIGVGLPVDRYPEFFDRVRRVPGVEQASLITSVPGVPFRNPGFVSVNESAWLNVDVNSVSTGFFKMMGIPILVGRDFTEQDAGISPPPVLITETLARALFPAGDSVGRSINRRSGPVQVIGIVKDTKTRGARGGFVPVLYPYSLSGGTLLITSNGSASIFSAVQQLLREFDPDFPLISPRSLQSHIEGSLSTERLAAVLVSVLGFIALMLTLIGLYGVTAFSVAARHKEIGIRRAIGAQTIDVLRLVLGQTGLMVAWGLLAGIGGSSVLAPVISTMLYGVDPTDEFSLLLSCGFMAVTAAVASFIPSWSASRVGPSVILRHD